MSVEVPVAQTPEELDGMINLSQGLNVVFRSPHKSLSLEIKLRPNQLTATTRVQNEDALERETGETTAAYKKARDTIQDVADMTGSNILYVFTSQNDRMKA